jgi:hypothetical protein
MSQIHSILFTGHMIDKSDRKHPRFPAAKESAAKEHIRKAVLQIKDKSSGTLLGIAGGACGGDILFHEVCDELGIETEFLLALPPEEFINHSVSFAGHKWVDRFWNIYNKEKHGVLPGSKELLKKKDGSLWQENNRWLLDTALKNGGENMTLIALWDGKGGDGPGGTEHMVNTAKEKGAVIMIIHMQEV